MWWPESSLQGEGQGHRPSVAAVLAFETDPAPVTLCGPPLTPPLEHSLSPFFVAQCPPWALSPPYCLVLPLFHAYCCTVPAFRSWNPGGPWALPDFSSCLEWAVSYGIGPAFLLHTQGGIAHNPSAPGHSLELPQLCVNPWSAGRPLFLILLS